MDISDVFRKLDMSWLAQKIADLSIEGSKAGVKVGAAEAEIDLTNQPPNMGAIRDLEERSIILSEKTRDRLIGDLNKSLMEGIRARESIDDIRRRVNDVFVGMKTWETERVVRTEVLHAANNGRLSAWQKSNVVQYKMWYNGNIMGRRTADDSKRMYGQIQAVDESFVDPAGKWSGMMPPMRPNDRCSAIPLRKLPKDITYIAGQMYDKTRVQPLALTFKSAGILDDVEKGGPGSGIKGHKTYHDKVKSIRDKLLSFGDNIERSVITDKEGKVLGTSKGEEEGTVEPPKVKGKNLVMHHNHPDNSPPSEGDFRDMANREELDTMWVHTKDTTYKVEIGEGVSRHDLWVESKKVYGEHREKVLDRFVEGKISKDDYKKELIKAAERAILELDSKKIIKLTKYNVVNKAWTDEARRAALEARKRKSGLKMVGEGKPGERKRKLAELGWDLKENYLFSNVYVSNLTEAHIHDGKAYACSVVEYEGKTANLLALEVNKPLHRKGFGVVAMADIVVKVMKEGADKIKLASMNRDSSEFYRALGMNEIEHGVFEGDKVWMKALLKSISEKQ